MSDSTESYTVQQIQEAFARHARSDDWGVPAFYVGGLIAALRGEYDQAVHPSLADHAAEQESSE